MAETTVPLSITDMKLHPMDSKYSFGFKKSAPTWSKTGQRNKISVFRPQKGTVGEVQHHVRNTRSLRGFSRPQTKGEIFKNDLSIENEGGLSNQNSTKYHYQPSYQNLIFSQRGNQKGSSIGPQGFMNTNNQKNIFSRTGKR